MSRSISLRPAALLFIVHLLPSCSLVFVTRPPSVKDAAAGNAVDCTTSKVAPIIDTVFLASDLVGLMLNVSQKTQSERDEDAQLAAIAGNVLGIGLFGGAAIYGFMMTSRCSALRQQNTLVDTNFGLGTVRSAGTSSVAHDGYPDPHR